MKIITSIAALRALTAPWRQQQECIAFIPTMGNLHAGHLALVKKAKNCASKIIISIFVNPLQFGVNEDFNTYPRTLAADIKQLEHLGIDGLFAPTAEELYPNGLMPLTRVITPPLSQELCGQSRPDFFQGVTTIVTKLFNCVQPNLAIFGEKDFQQLVIVRHLVNDLNFPIEIIAVPIKRETDGLALSSRNQYLTIAEREIAPYFYQALAKISAALSQGATDFEALCAQAINELTALGFKVDYIAIRQQNSLRPALSTDRQLAVLGAIFLGTTRLIDNQLINLDNLP